MVCQKKILVRAVLFDFEGTVVDFQWKLAEAVAETLATLARAGFSPEDYGPSPGYAHLFNRTLDLADEGSGDAGIEDARRIISAIYDRYDADALVRWNAVAGAHRVLDHLRNKGLPVGMVSNVGRAAFKKAAKKLQFEGRLDTVVSRDDVSRIKPHPEGLVKAARTLGVDPAHTLFVGDAFNDVAAARAAGMMACYVSGGEDTLQALERCAPDLVIAGLNELIDCIGLE